MTSYRKGLNIKPRAVRAAVGAAAAALAAGVLWSAPTASAGTPFCDSLPPRDARECNCGFDFAPGSPELHDCLYGNTPAPQRP